LALCQKSVSERFVRIRAFHRADELAGEFESPGVGGGDGRRDRAQGDQVVLRIGVGGLRGRELRLHQTNGAQPGFGEECLLGVWRGAAGEDLGHAPGDLAGGERRADARELRQAPGHGTRLGGVAPGSLAALDGVTIHGREAELVVPPGPAERLDGLAESEADSSSPAAHSGDLPIEPLDLGVRKVTIAESSRIQAYCA